MAPVWWAEGFLVFMFIFAFAPILFLFWLMSSGSIGEFVDAVVSTYGIPVRYLVRPFMDD